MIERKYDYIVIQRARTSVARVTPEASSIRKFELMSEDYVRLDFVLPNPVSIEIGDYINDEIFGKFVITEKQMPEYIDATGGYKYSLKFQAEYMAWKNKIFMLTTDASGSRVRKEATWYLTNDMEAQVEEVINNLAVLGQAYTYAIGTEVTKAKEIRALTWDGVSIYQALATIAEEWACEFWIDRTAKVIHFGKCDEGNQAEVFEANKNVAKMTIQPNSSTYADKIFVYGGKENLPASYRKRLEIKATASPKTNYYTGDKKITADMFAGVSASQTISVIMPADGVRYYSAIAAESTRLQIKGGTFQAPANKTISVTIPAFTAPALTTNFDSSDTGRLLVDYSLVLVRADGTSQELKKITKTARYTQANQASVAAFDFGATSADLELLRGGNYFALVVNISANTLITLATLGAFAVEDLELNIGEASVTAIVPVTFGGTDYYIRLNPDGVPPYDVNYVINQAYYYWAFCSEAGVVTTPPDGFAIGSAIIVTTKAGDIIPTAFYTSDTDNPAALARIGETRLQMPVASAPGNYLKRTGVTEANAVELAVAFEDIYPTAKMVVSSVVAEEKTDVEQYEGESVSTAWTWHEYTLGLKLWNGGEPVDFIFDQDYILANQTLQIRFLTANDIDESASEYADIIKLSGMTFEARYNRASNTFTLVRNSDFGTSLPNDVLLPIVGAPCQLIGWDVRALADMGVIAAAEQKLYAKGQEYLNAIEEGQFTFTCVMAFDYLFESLEYLDLTESASRTYVDSDRKVFQVKNDYNAYALPTEGHRVQIKHNALKAPKTSRVIGYEFKLDKPYDGPTYTIGETQAYSRLAKIEREISKISK